MMRARVSSVSQDRGPLEIKVSEVVLRKQASKIVQPLYPEEALKQGASGVSVTALVIGLEGNIEKLDVLEAPHPSIKAAVATAVRQWKFGVTTMEGNPVKVHGKLTFYFVLNNKKAEVLSPEEMSKRTQRQ